jgi:integrase/recombinase XerD
MPSNGAALERAAETWLRQLAIERGLSTNTTAAYRRDLERYVAYVPVSEPSAITREHVTGYLAHLSLEVSKSSAARMLSTVRSFHRFLLDERIVDVDVAASVKPPKLGMSLPKAITIDQMAALLATTDGDDPQRIRDKALLELLYATGARISEAVALNVDDLIDGDVIRLFGKGGKQRVVPLGSYARRAIDAYLVRVRPQFAQRTRDPAALFLGIRGQRMSRQNAWLIVQRAAERAGFEKELSPHTFRHSFATHLLAGGADVRVVQELLGHASVSTTQIYTLVTVDALRDVYETSHPRAR